MGPLDDVRRLLEGDLSAIDVASLPLPAAETIASKTGLLAEPPSAEELGALLDDYLGQGQILRGLALLKVCAETDRGGHRMLHLLERAFDAGLDEDGNPDTIDPLAKEFLGSERPHIAWSVLVRDRLEIAAVPNAEGHFGGNGWLICHDDRARSSEAEHGLAIVWWNTTPVAGKLRPAGRRRVSRRKIPLQVKLVFVGQHELGKSHRRVEAELEDVSKTGVGVILPNCYGRFRTETLNHERIRMEICLPSGHSVPSSLARIVWAKDDVRDGEAIVRIGIQFLDPPPEFVQSIEEMLVQGKGDQQYLWNLWESQTTRS